MLLNFILQRNFTTVGAPEKSFYQSLEKSTIAPPPEKILRRPWIGIYFVSNALAHVLLKDADKFQESYRSTGVPNLHAFRSPCRMLLQALRVSAIASTALRLALSFLTNLQWFASRSLKSSRWLKNQNGFGCLIVLIFLSQP